MMQFRRPRGCAAESLLGLKLVSGGPTDGHEAANQRTLITRSVGGKAQVF